ncbi:MAG: RNase adapter RapZ [Lachnospiraceae bacterium]
MKFVIVTGMSGAGRSTALKMLEDFGFFCVDNLPVQLLNHFANVVEDDQSIDRVAFGVDVRSGHWLDLMEQQLAELDKKEICYEILFLDATDETLVRRYKETRRTHPLSRYGRVEEGIYKERRMLRYLKDRSTYVLDTSMLLTRELKNELEKIFVLNESYANFFITILSFGFKYGIPNDSDLVFDVRFLPNPYYDTALRPLTGNDKPIQDFVLASENAHIFLDKTEDMLKFLIPNYIDEGKHQLVISIGCTGGKHRSVTLANALARRMEKSSYSLKVEHRDIWKDTVTKE